MSASYTKRTLENLASLNRKFRVQAEAFLAASQPIAERHKITIEVISGLRSWAQQNALYAQGRTKPGRIVTKARAGSSWHNYGLAIDLGLFAGGKYLDSADPRRADRIYAELGKLAASMGIEWAGTWTSFTETPHFQNRYGMSISQARAKMESVNFDHQKIV
jgi:peptidoglycan L-alanyl-D-glutamate endopeptidase CwlK